MRQKVDTLEAGAIAQGESKIARDCQGHVKRAELSGDLLGRIRAIYDAIKSVYEVSLEQFEIAFMLDADPAGEVVLWEQIVVAYTRVVKEAATLDRKTILETILGHSMGLLTTAEQDDADVRRIIDVAEGR